METLTKRFVIVGAGPGNEIYLTEAARQAISSARVLAGARRFIDEFAPDGAMRVPFEGPIEAWLDHLDECPDAPIVVPVSGDPGVSSIAKRLLERFGREQCRVIPGISSVQMACAALGIPWENAAIISAHAAIPGQLRNDLEQRDPWVILLGAKGGEAFAAQLAARTDRRVYCLEDLSLTSERVGAISAEELTQLPAHPRRIIVLTRELS
ncbi:MAG TPA: precorrin-6y C5,15-methyltransferase (decarboxylating) subunit CbiE [Polyangiaceae bacterium]|nr:precorrin-6y C5,15-methyltransferase (decarboxylating) subunit CbiE [Polyangiaceae bacterium]